MTSDPFANPEIGAGQAHSDMGFSKLHQVFACPGSVKAQMGKPDTSSPAAAEGTVAHELAAWAIDPTQPKAEDPNTYTQEMYDGAEIYAEFVQHLNLEAMWVEQRVGLGKLSKRVWGTSDGIGIDDEGHLHVWDYKFGRVPVYPKQSHQMMGGAIGAMATLGIKADIIHMHIIQPRDGREHPTHTWSCDIEELKEFAIELKQVEELAYGPNPPRHASEKACRYCKGKSDCDEFARQAEAVARGEFEGVALSDRMDIVPMLKLFIKDTEEATKSALVDEIPVPGWRLKEGRATRKWTDPADAEAFLRKKKFRVVDIKPPTLISPATADKLLKKKGIAPDALMEYITVSRSAPSLARDVS